MRIRSTALGPAQLLSVSGTLNAATYRTLRDAVIKAALDQPTAVMVDIDDMRVPAESALSVFTSARWHVSRWPNVPVALITTSEATRAALRRNGIPRYVPVFSTVEEILMRLGGRDLGPMRLRARLDLPAEADSLNRARRHVTDCLVDWHKDEYVGVASVVTTVLVDNALSYTDSPIAVRLECNDVVVIAVDDCSSVQAVRSETGERVPGLEMLAAMTRAWGNLPSPTGKTVWAELGPDDVLGG